MNTNNLISAQTSVINNENTLVTLWYQYQLYRLQVYRDLGILPFDEWEAFDEIFPPDRSGRAADVAIGRDGRPSVARAEPAGAGRRTPLRCSGSAWRSLERWRWSPSRSPGIKKPLMSSLFASTKSDMITAQVQPDQAGGDRQGEGKSRKLGEQGRALRGRGRRRPSSRSSPKGPRSRKGTSSPSSTRRPSRDALINQKITTQQAEASYKQAKLVREVAEYAVKEYVEGIYLQEKATDKGQIKLAESDRERAIDRLQWLTEMFKQGVRLQGDQHRRPAHQAAGRLRPRAGPDAARRPREVHQGEADQVALQRRREGQGRRALQAVEPDPGADQGKEARAADREMHPEGPRRRHRGLRQRARPDGRPARRS